MEEWFELGDRMIGLITDFTSANGVVGHGTIL